MQSTLFLQSEVSDPFNIYARMLKDHPVYRDEKNKYWALYAYESCKKVLNNPVAQVPAINLNNKDGLNEYALSITNHVVRLRNGTQHEVARQIAVMLFDRMSNISIYDLMEMLIHAEHKGMIEWVDTVCKKLPVLAVLESFNFNAPDRNLILLKVDQLVKIMLPNKTYEQVQSINDAAKEIYCATEKHLLQTGKIKSIADDLSAKYTGPFDNIISLCVGNLIGLFIQGYDAGRGLLSNALLQMLVNNNLHQQISDKGFIERSVIETLRFDPPVHNTRRIAVDDFIVNDTLIRKDENIFLVLAAANRDEQRFANPDIFDIYRQNNHDHLTFGLGGHTCLAKYFSVWLATEALMYLFERYKNITLTDNNIQYEPMVNVRLPKNIFISLS